MPDVASQKAIEALKLHACSEENNCQIQLKEMNQNNENKVVYEVQVQKQARILGLFKAKLQMQAQINAENGEVIQTQKPRWSFLVF